MVNADSWVQTVDGLRPKQRSALLCELRGKVLRSVTFERRKIPGTLRVLAQTVDGPIMFSVAVSGWVRGRATSAIGWRMTPTW